MLLNNVPLPKPRPSLLEQAQNQYPILQGLNLGYVVTPKQNSGYLEYWPAGETGTADNSRPSQLPINKPGLQIFRNDVRPIDILGDVVSHQLVNTDSTLRQDYNNFAGSITPQQEQMLRDRYAYSVKNWGENRPYAEWRKISGVPSLFRGNVFQQGREFPADKYTPQQLQMFIEMMKYLKRPRL